MTATPATPARQPRAIGQARLSGKRLGARTVIDGLRQSGSMKLLFPRGHGAAMTGVLLNTAGGLTGGDRFDVAATAGTGSHLVMTTQAAERAYRAQPGEVADLATRLTLAADSRLDWLPQETLLYEGSALRRSLRIDMAGTARLLLCGPLVLGRAAMGEAPRNLFFADRIDLHRDGRLLWADRVRLEGDATARMAGTATGGGCGAMATVLLAATDADRLLDPARALMPATGGVSLVRDGLLAARLLAPDSFELRKTLFPLLELFGGGPLPRTWMI